MRRGFALVLSIAGAAVVLALAANAWLLTTATVTSDSMAPTLAAGDTVAVWRPSAVQRGDIVVFDGSVWPGDANEGVLMVKRVVGLPGDRVAVHGGAMWVNGSPVAEPYATGAGDVDFDVVVPAGKAWVMGDNREVSQDSRAYLGAAGGGFVPLNNVEGKVVAVAWPPAQARTVGPS